MLHFLTSDSWCQTVRIVVKTEKVLISDRILVTTIIVSEQHTSPQLLYYTCFLFLTILSRNGCKEARMYLLVVVTQVNLVYWLKDLLIWNLMELIANDLQGCILKPSHIFDRSLTKIIPTFLFMPKNIHRAYPLYFFHLSRCSVKNKLTNLTEDNSS